MSELPGEDLVMRGLEDLRAGRETVESLLVSIGAPRQRGLGLLLPETPPEPETRLYRMLARESGKGTHSRYNALVRRLVSYEHALEFERGRRSRAGLVDETGERDS